MTFLETVLACSIGGIAILTIQRFHKAFIVLINTESQYPFTWKEKTKAILTIALLGKMETEKAYYREG